MTTELSCCRTNKPRNLKNPQKQKRRRKRMMMTIMKKLLSRGANQKRRVNQQHQARERKQMVRSRLKKIKKRSKFRKFQRMTMTSTVGKKKLSRAHPNKLKKCRKSWKKWNCNNPSSYSPKTLSSSLWVQTTYFSITKVIRGISAMCSKIKVFQHSPFLKMHPLCRLIVKSTRVTIPTSSSRAVHCKVESS